ncbi:MAG: HAD family hydrolase [Bdellovibrionaceae bacterium]|nr:HAD family hydrolase [Pseudobdellovibrionaceae bacterium]NUM58079.1 HAD family hydrolase [Pseudobdellovibrionaceae bacterium]
MKKIGLLFDCDGTLVDSLGLAKESFEYALNFVGEKRSYEEVKSFFGAGADRIFMNLLQDKKKSQIAFDAFLNHQQSLAWKTRLHNGIRDLLVNLAYSNITMGIVTGRHSLDLNIILEPHKIKKYFDVVIADSDVLHSKPAPDGLLLAIKKMSLKPEDVFYIGDSVTDMQAAQRAGCKAIAAVWDSATSSKIMLEVKPNYIANTPFEVLDYVKKHLMI